MRRSEIEPSSIGRAPEQVGFTSDRCSDQFRSTFRLQGAPGACAARRTFGELLIDLEEDNAARAVVFGLLAEMER
jgi:hypothetical protein